MDDFGDMGPAPQVIPTFKILITFTPHTLGIFSKILYIIQLGLGMVDGLLWLTNKNLLTEFTVKVFTNRTISGNIQSLFFRPKKAD